MDVDMNKKGNCFSINIYNMDGIEFDRIRTMLYSLFVFSNEKNKAENFSLKQVMNMVLEEQK